MDLNNVDVHVLVEEGSMTDKCFNLLFNIHNNVKDIAIKNTFIIPIIPKVSPILIANFILMIKHGKTKETLSITWDKFGIEHNKIRKIQFLFVSEEGNIISNSIDIH